MLSKRPYILSVSGFDPSGGAGVLADIKTFEANKVCGMGVVSALTFQNDTEFDSVRWIDTEEILKQISVLSRRMEFYVVKIGLIKDLQTLESIITNCKSQITDCKIIWDPIIKASAGFEFHKNFEEEKLFSVLKNIYLITPNSNEVRFLTGMVAPMKAAEELSNYCNVFLKGEYYDMKDVKKIGRDFLFTTNGKNYSYRAKKISSAEKHGSGCVLSSAIAANLAKGESLQRSCLKGKDYVTNFLMSNKTLLGYHKI
ncbi:MAG: hydroxymethylpyrimidine/phosphomethylpyrimidine kinase [Bacteroidota bacterium]